MLGRLRVTPGADKVLSGLEIGYALMLHAQGDWGDVSAELRVKNNRALENGGRLLSMYSNHADVSFFIVTEVGRSATMVFLPCERHEYSPDNMQNDGNGSTLKKK